MIKAIFRKMVQETHRPDTETLFRTCPKCGFEWRSRDQFINDPNIMIIGYQLNYVEFVAGFFYFNHSCKDTFTIRANVFENLYNSPVFENWGVGSELFPEHCLRYKESESCPIKCECAFVKKIIQKFRKRVDLSPELIENDI